MIELSHLSKTYRLGFFRLAYPAIRDINLKIKKNTIYGFVGPNGAGKTTTLKLIMGLIKPTSGHVKIMGEPSKNHKIFSQVGFLPELPYFYDYLTGKEFLEFYGKLNGLKSSEISERTRELINVIKLDPGWLDKKLRTYSKGMIQKLGLIQAVIHNPKLVILDEPMSGLDPVGRVEVRDLLLHLKERGVTVFYSSHVLSDVELVCDEVAIIVKGSIRKSGKMDDILTSGSLEDVFTQEVESAKSWLKLLS